MAHGKAPNKLIPNRLHADIRGSLGRPLKTLDMAYEMIRLSVSFLSHTCRLFMENICGLDLLGEDLRRYGQCVLIAPLCGKLEAS